jgi:hypothetical protein
MGPDPSSTVARQARAKAEADKKSETPSQRPTMDKGKVIQGDTLIRGRPSAASEPVDGDQNDYAGSAVVISGGRTSTPKTGPTKPCAAAASPSAPRSAGKKVSSLSGSSILFDD